MGQYITTPVAATGLLTSDNTNVSNNDTVVIAGRTYTFKTTLTGAADEVLIGADADASLTNLRNLINSGRAAAAASTTITSDNTNPVAGKVIVLGAKTFTFVSALSEVKASGTLTSDNTNVEDGETVTIDTVTYTFKTKLSPGVPNQVKIGADADTTLTNLKSAINGESQYADARFSIPTVIHPTVSCGAVSSHAVVITAKSVGTAGNSIASTETSAHLSFGGSTLASGANAVTNQVLIGATANDTLQNIKDAVNGTASAIGVTVSTGTVASTQKTAGTLNTTAHTLVVTAINTGSAGNSLTSTTDDAHLSLTASTFTGGFTASSVNASVTSGAVTAHTITLTAASTGTAGNAITTTETSSHLSFGAVNLTGGVDSVTSGTGMDRLVPNATKPQQNQATGATYFEEVGPDGATIKKGAAESGVINVNGVAVTPKFAKIDRATSADGAAVVPLVANKRIRVLKYHFVCAGAVGAKWQSSDNDSSGAGSNTDLTGLETFAANGGISESYTPVGIMQTKVGEGLKLNLNGAIQVSGALTYIEV